MTPQEFCFWLQGFFELTGTRKLTEAQVATMRDHLALVFDKQTPDRIPYPLPRPDPFPWAPHPVGPWPYVPNEPVVPAEPFYPFTRPIITC